MRRNERQANKLQKKKSFDNMQSSASLFLKVEGKKIAYVVFLACSLKYWFQNATESNEEMSTGLGEDPL